MSKLEDVRRYLWVLTQPGRHPTEFPEGWERASIIGRSGSSEQTDFTEAKEYRKGIFSPFQFFAEGYSSGNAIPMTERYRSICLTFICSILSSILFTMWRRDINLLLCTICCVFSCHQQLWFKIQSSSQNRSTQSFGLHVFPRQAKNIGKHLLMIPDFKLTAISTILADAGVTSCLIVHEDELWHEPCILLVCIYTCLYIYSHSWVFNDATY